MTLGLNFACLGDQPQKVNCCLLSLVVLLRLVFISEFAEPPPFKFSLAAGLKLVAEEVDDRRRRLQFFDGVTSSLTSTSIKKALNSTQKWTSNPFKIKVLFKKIRENELGFLMAPSLLLLLLHTHKQLPPCEVNTMTTQHQPEHYY